jgi:hypothetical protein
VPRPKSRIVGRYYSPTVPLDTSFNLLRTCRQINAEARSLFENEGIAYIPILGNMSYGDISAQSNEDGYLTIIKALKTFTTVHFHMHINKVDPLPRKPPHWLFASLLSTLRLFSRASRSLTDERKTKRRAMVHFDHFFHNWNTYSVQQDCSFADLINHMGSDRDTIWEIRYYIRAHASTMSLYQRLIRLGVVQQRCTQMHDSLEWRCMNYPNITLKAEIYGNMKHIVQGMERKTADVTRSSVHWPSWPENVPWRGGLEMSFE